MPLKNETGKVRRVSRADVAKIVGVAPCTVSLVLNNTPNTRVREEVRQRIRDVATELGYRPSATARALVTGCTNSIGVVIFQGGNPFDVYTNGILSKFWERIHAEKYRLIIDSKKMNGNAAEYFIDHVADGIMLLAPPREVTNLDIMQKAKFPLVCVGNTPDCSNVDYVDLDNYAASKKITQYLIAHGHRKIAHIAGILEHSSAAVERLNGYKDSLEEAGIKYDQDLVAYAEFVYDSGRNAALELLKRKTDFTAVFAAASDNAYGVIDEIESRGLRVPDDISVATIKLVTRVVGRSCEVTGIINPLKDIGANAADILFKRINGMKGSPIEKKLDGELFIGNTVKRLR